MCKGVAVLIEDESRSKPSYLMLEQDRSQYGTGVHYAPPAGTFEPEFDGTPKNTAVREIREETGIEVNREELQKLFETGAEHGVDRLVWYKVEKEIDYNQIDLNHESQDCKILTKAEALDENLLEDTRKALQRLK
jgi:8-oxo-dGTP pyrophosphatase MutT (NUDIX family)